MFGVDDALLVMGGTQLAGSIMGANAARGAAGDQASATRSGIDEQRREYDITRSDTAPYRSAGTSALAKLRAALGIPDLQATGGAVQYGGNNYDNIDALRQTLVDDYKRQGGNPDNNPAYQNSLQAVLDKATPAGGSDPNAESSPLLRKFSVSDFWNDPVVKLGYQSGLDLGTKALKNAAPLTTGLDSGAAMKELTQFGTDYTGRTMAAPAQARFVGDQGNQFNKLAALAGVGQTAVGQTTSAGVPISGNISNMITSQGNANAGARIAGANAWSGGINNVANWWQSQNMLNRMFPQGSGGGVPAGGGWNTSNDWRM